MNELTRIDEFRKVLADYHPSDAAKKALEPTKLVLFVGPTSSGKNTIIGELLKTGKYHFLVSDTTRKPRENQGVPEQNGREYWFRTEDELLADLQAGQFLEAAIIHNQQVSGTSIREIVAAANEGKPALHEIEVVGADNVYAAKPDALFLFILPPSFDEWMARMRGRGQLPADEVKRRLQSAVMELETALQHDYYRFVVNDTYVHSAKMIEELIFTGEQDATEQQRGREIAEQLLEDTKAHLAS